MGLKTKLTLKNFKTTKRSFETWTAIIKKSKSLKLGLDIKRTVRNENPAEFVPGLSKRQIRYHGDCRIRTPGGWKPNDAPKIICDPIGALVPKKLLSMRWLVFFYFVS